MEVDASEYQNALLIQREISETLNKRTDLNEMLQLTLERLLNLMKLETGWIFLTDSASSYQLVADYNLPPALSDNREEMMVCNHGHTDCACLQLYWEGYMKKAVNHVKCARLEKAVANDMGKTSGLSHHASIPLKVRGKKIGLLNLASAGSRHFSEEELLFLETVAYQMGSAVERVRLYVEKTREEIYSVTRYIVNYYEKAEKINRGIANILTKKELYREIIQEIQDHLPSWEYSAIITQEAGRLIFQSESEYGISEYDDVLHEIMQKSYETRETIQSDGDAPYTVALPLAASKSPFEVHGVLLLSRSTSPGDHLELEILEVLADHISMVIERIQIHQEWEELLVEKERNRLARDLHDSVKQKLFAISLTVRGLKGMVGQQGNRVVETFEDVEVLSRDALSDMHNLIWQLRPDDGEQGLCASLKSYAEKIGVKIITDNPEVMKMDRTYEEALRKIGQEALNNIKKHAGTIYAHLELYKTERNFIMKIMDEGRGGASENESTIGIKSMRERAREHHGKITINSKKDKGTEITVKLPVKKGS